MTAEEGEEEEEEEVEGVDEEEEEEQVEEEEEEQEVEEEEEQEEDGLHIAEKWTSVSPCQQILEPHDDHGALDLVLIGRGAGAYTRSLSRQRST